MGKSIYPLKSQLNKIKNWEGDCLRLAEYVASLWYYPNRIKFYRGKDSLGRPIKKLYLSTGGWSGNEELIGALRENRCFWMLCWEQSKRGGHYWFKLPRMVKEG